MLEGQIQLEADGEDDERRSLEIRLADAMGDTAKADQMRMDDFLKGVDPANLDIARDVWNAEKVKAATGAVQDFTESTQSLLDMLTTRWNAAAEAVQKAEEARQAAIDRAATLRSDAAAREIDVLELLGRTGEAAAKRLQAEKAAADALMWPVIEAYAQLQDLKDREAKLAGEVTDARNTLAASYEREKSAITGTIDKMAEMAKQLREFNRTTMAEQFGEASNFRSVQVDFLKTVGLAGARDMDAMARLPELGQSYIKLAMDQARSQAEFERQAAYVASAVVGVADVADAAADQQRSTLEALNKLVEGRIDTSEKLVAVRDAVATLDDRLAAQADISRQLAESGNRALSEIARVLRSADGDGAPGGGEAECGHPARPLRCRGGARHRRQPE